MDTSSLSQPPQPSTPVIPTLSQTNRKIAIAVDLSDESAYAVKWAVNNYLKPGDTVVLLHVRPTTFLYGADWGTIQQPQLNATSSEEEFNDFVTSKTTSLAKPLADKQIPFKIHIVKDRDMKERLCLEVERLGLSGVIMGSRGFGAFRLNSNKSKKLGSVSDYCVQHCVCPVVVVNYPNEEVGTEGIEAGDAIAKLGIGQDVVVELDPVPEEEELLV
ncbi:hypothetical protein ACFE04_030310 [Oxalis oulophora]